MKIHLKWSIAEHPQHCKCQTFVKAAKFLSRRNAADEIWPAWRNWADESSRRFLDQQTFLSNMDSGRRISRRTDKQATGWADKMTSKRPIEQTICTVCRLIWPPPAAAVRLKMDIDRLTRMVVRRANRAAKRCSSHTRLSSSQMPPAYGSWPISP